MPRRRPLVPAKKSLYGNWVVMAPGGKPMFRCDEKRAAWYVERGLAEKAGDLAVRLLFEPGGPGGGDDPFSMGIRENRCVVCGDAEALTRHHVVPQCYRRWFPDEYKCHDCHDVVAMCVACHGKYEELADSFKRDLARKHGVSCRKEPSNHALEARRAGAAWLTLNRHGALIPNERKALLEAAILAYFGRDKDQVDMKEAMESRWTYDRDAGTQGRDVVAATKDIGDLVRAWREHFVSHMAPRHMPAGWDVNRGKNT
jgi:hypothetical protein